MANINPNKIANKKANCLVDIFMGYSMEKLLGLIIYIKIVLKKMAIIQSI
jgi:hypothetical protein